MTETKNMTIPSDWEILHLGEIFKLTSGKTKPSELFDEHVDEYIYPVYGGNGIIGFAKEFNSEGENILIGRVGEYCGITRFLNEKCWITDNALYSKDFLIDIDAKFLVYKLQLDDLSKLRNKGGQPLISQGPISLNKVCIPRSLPEQKAIARVLSTWDEAIYKTKQLIIQKELRKKWLMQNLLTGKMRLKGFDGEWKKCSAFDFLKQRNEQATNNGNIPLFSLTIENGITEKSDRYEREFLVKDKSIKNYKIVYPNDIVFNPANLRWGAIAKHSRNFKVLLSPIYEVLTVKQGYNIDFISYLVSSPRQISYYASILEGTLIERMAVKVEPFLSTKYEIPPFKEQTAIAEILQASDKEINLLKAKVEKLKEQKKGLMQVLLTGKVRIKY